MLNEREQALLWDMKVKLNATEKERDELRAELAEATVEIEALSKALCDGNDELLRRRKELEEARRLAEKWRNTSVLAGAVNPGDWNTLPWEVER
jgi:septal ring factor EnvC (AmiA/AmiB activator)